MLEVRSELNRIADEQKQAVRSLVDKKEALDKAELKLNKAGTPGAQHKLQEEVDTLKAEIAGLQSVNAADGAVASATFLPGYMLLIDEPETALHPAAIRAATEHLYSLAAESGWQVMLSTHHPAFIDPLKDHTTIVRLRRLEANAPPNIYRADTANFSDDEKATLKALLTFDGSVAEMFFADKVIVVEGDTEFAAFTVAMDADTQGFPVDHRPLLLRARGKWTIPLLIRMLAHFKVPCAVLHDVDAPRLGESGRKSSAYSANANITLAIHAAREAGIHIIHRCSTPDFEREHGMDLPSKDKPFRAWSATKNCSDIQQRVRATLDHLNQAPTATAADHSDDGRHFEVKCRDWAATNAAADPAFSFDRVEDAPSQAAVAE